MESLRVILGGTLGDGRSPAGCVDDLAREDLPWNIVTPRRRTSERHFAQLPMTESSAESIGLGAEPTTGRRYGEHAHCLPLPSPLTRLGGYHARRDRRGEKGFSAADRR